MVQGGVENTKEVCLAYLLYSPAGAFRIQLIARPPKGGYGIELNPEQPSTQEWLTGAGLQEALENLTAQPPTSTSNGTE